MSNDRYSPCVDPPEIGSQIWILGQCSTRDETPFAATVLEIAKETRREKEYCRLKLRGFRNDTDHEWSLPQGSYGFSGLYFWNEIECRKEYLRQLQNRDRREKLAAKKLAEQIREAKIKLKEAAEKIQ